MKTIQKVSFIQNRLHQLNAKSLSLQFPPSCFQPLQWQQSQDIRSLVPNFFTSSMSFELMELKDEYKIIPQDKQYNSVTNTYAQLRIPLKTDEKLRLQFTNLSTNFVRIGRLLEVLDSLVGMVAYKHCYTDLMTRSRTIATLGVYDFMIFTNQINNSSDLTMNSYMSYVGKSSIEINSDIYQDNNLTATVSFVMVSRNAENYGKAEAVPQLIDEENLDIRDLCQLRKDLGKLNQQKRILESQRQTVPPNSDESELLHEIMLKHKVNGGVLMGQTRIEKNTLMHSQDRNLHGKAFGGLIMKEIIELGWLVGYKHAFGQPVRIVHIFDVTFLAPIKIGSVISYNSKLCYTEGQTMIIQVQVDVHTYNEGNLEMKKTTEVFLAMVAEQNVNEIVPQTYEEGILYLHGKRLMDKLR